MEIEYSSHRAFFIDQTRDVAAVTMLLSKNILPTEEAICHEFVSKDLDVALCKAYLGFANRVGDECSLGAVS